MSVISVFGIEVREECGEEFAVSRQLIATHQGCGGRITLNPIAQAKGPSWYLIRCQKCFATATSLEIQGLFLTATDGEQRLLIAHSTSNYPQIVVRQSQPAVIIQA